MKWINLLIFVLFFCLVILKIFGKKEHKHKNWYVFLEQHFYLAIVLVVVNLISFAAGCQKLGDEIRIAREGIAGSEKEVGILLGQGEKQEEFLIQVANQKLTKKQLAKKMEEAFSYLEQNMKGENDSLERVTRNLDFTLDYETFPFEVEIRPNDYLLLDESGTIRNTIDEIRLAGYTKAQLQKGISTEFTVILQYGDVCKEKIYSIKIFEKEKTKLEEQFAGVVEQIQEKEKDTKYDAEFCLPKQIAGVDLNLSQNGRLGPGKILCAGIILCFLLVLREKENEKHLEQKRQDDLLRCYPWFVNEMVLLLGAGMQVKNIFCLLIQEYQDCVGGQSDTRKPLMEELMIAKQNLQMGVSEQQVYYQLGRSLKLPCYIKLTTLLAQNVKKGSKGMVAFFEQEEIAALQERKNLAKKCGEEAGTKLLGPMVLQLLVVMLMIMIPAFLSL